MHGFWVASLQVWPRWALIEIRFVEKYFTCVKDPEKSGQSLVAALQSRPPLTLTINTIRDYVSIYNSSHHFTSLHTSSIYVRRSGNFHKITRERSRDDNVFHFPPIDRKFVFLICELREGLTFFPFPEPQQQQRARILLGARQGRSVKPHGIG